MAVATANQYLERLQDSKLYHKASPLINYLQTIRPRTWALIGFVAASETLTNLRTYIGVHFSVDDSEALIKGCIKHYVPSGTVLEIDLRLVRFREEESCAKGLLKLLPVQGVHLHSVIRSIIRGSSDPKVVGLVVTMDKMAVSISQLEEIREAVLKFRASGKRTMIHTNTFVEIGYATVYYWFACAFEEIYMPNIGSLNFVGLKIQVPFLRQLLDKIGAQPQLTARRKYKTMANMVMEDKFTPEHKESVEHIVHTLFDRMVADIASSRGFTVDQVKELVYGGPYTAEKALELKLVDGLLYEDEFYDNKLAERFSHVPKSLLLRFCNFFMMLKGIPPQPKDVFLLFAENYYNRTGGSPYGSKKHGCSTKVALINVIGNIHMGKSHREWDGSTTSAGAETVILGLRQAIANKKIKAIVLRIMSGGGSAVASDLIAQQVLAAKKAGKTVIVSMSQMAASGGYYIACYADKIVANATTLTGSIGVVAGKVNLKESLARVGVTFDSVQTSFNADMSDPLANYEGENKEKLESWVDVLYEKFKGHVAKGRNLSAEAVEAVAQGQVWTGQAALERGLIDHIGGLETAINITKHELNLKEDAKIQLKVLPDYGGLLSYFKPPINSRILPRSTHSLAFIPNLLNTVTSLGYVWKTMNLVCETSHICDLLDNISSSSPSLSSDGDLTFEPSFTSGIGSSNIQMTI